MVTKRGKNYFLRIRPFGGSEVGVKTPARNKTEAKQIEMAVMTACRAGDYSGLDPVSREVCLRLFRNQGLEIPPSLSVGDTAKPELTLWNAIELVIKDPEVRHSANRERLEQCFVRLVEKWGKDFPVKSIRVPQIKLYRSDRLRDGAAPATVNREKSALSKMFQILMEHELVERNPARDVKNLSEKTGERQVYIGFDDFQAILAALPGWRRPFAQAAYYTGMRRGEIAGLRRDQVNLSRRIILIGPEDTKEGQWKRVPIHRALFPVLEDVMKVRSIGSDKVFLKDGRELTRGNGRRPWEDAVREVGLDPTPHFHDLRHTWKTNARRSGMDPEIRESIMGHWYKEKSVSERYGRISDEELLRAIDLMTFNHGSTEIVVSKRQKQNPGKGGHPQPGNLRTRRVQNDI
jgi:integrase